MGKFGAWIVAIVATVVGGMQSAFAALPAAVSAAVTEAQTDALALIDLVWPYVAAVTVGFLLYKLFKRGLAKA
ncbi:MAG: major coat protein [Lysobacterales bacterium]